MKNLFLLSFMMGLMQLHAQPKQHTLVIFFDGLRPDYITTELMPNLTAFKKANTYGENHHSVFPTVTRVNSSSYATGAYPGQNGLMGNNVFFPKVKKNGAMDTGEAEDLNKINQSENGNLLLSVSLGELLENAGKKMMVFSSGSTGQALLQNHKAASSVIINPAMILPVSMRDSFIRELGPIPLVNKNDNSLRHQWVTDALIRYGLVADGPAVSAVWLNDPDGAAHSNGIGSPEANNSLKAVDAQFGRMIATLTERNLIPYFNILISTDHGFITYGGKDNITDLLIKEGLKENKESDDVVVAGGSIHVRDHDKEKIKKIVLALQKENWIGSVFTKGKNKNDMYGWVPGTLSFASIHWDNEQRSGDILADYNWNDDKNKAGYAGTNFAKGVAGHGSLSPYEVHIPFIVSGPAFKKMPTSELPTSNVDITPTVLRLQGVAVPSTVDGRVLEELLTNSKQKASVPTKEVIKTEVDGQAGHYTLKLQISRLGKYFYVDHSIVERTQKVDALK